jgi:signal transduction histidine kinase
MKRLSTRLRLTLWFSAMLLIIANVVFFIAYQAVESIVVTQRENSFARSAETVRTHMQIKQDDRNQAGRGIAGFDPTRFALTPGMACTIYSAEGNWADGLHIPWIDALPKNTGKAWKIRQPEGNWHFYDIDLDYAGEYVGYARLFHGPKQYMNEIDEQEYILFYLYAMLSSLFIAFLGGLWIAGRALKSLKIITATAVEIGSGDLSKRINWTGGIDEIGILANTLDSMADSLQKAFAREKEFTSDVSHEIRTPLASIIASAESAEYSDDLPTYRSSVKNILTKSRQLQSMTNQLLMLSRESEQGKQLIIEEVALNIVLEDIADEVRTQAEGRNITIKTDIASHLTIPADLTLFTILMLNLVHNAVKYGKDGGYVEISALPAIEHGVVRILIRDNGIGISDEDMPHIFQRFYRADKSRSGEGAGLGLAFAQMIVNMHNGKMWVESKPGEGSRFFVELPKY